MLVLSVLLVLSVFLVTAPIEAAPRIALSALSQSRHLQHSIDGLLERREASATFGPPPGKSYVIILDDLNLPGMASERFTPGRSMGKPLELVIMLTYSVSCESSRWRYFVNNY